MIASSVIRVCRSCDVLASSACHVSPSLTGSDMWRMSVIVESGFSGKSGAGEVWRWAEHAFSNHHSNGAVSHPQLQSAAQYPLRWVAPNREPWKCWKLWSRCPRVRYRREGIMGASFHVYIKHLSILEMRRVLEVWGQFWCDWYCCLGFS